MILNLVIIGEAATKLLKDYKQFLDQHPDIPWRSIKGMRNRIAHGYFVVTLMWFGIRFRQHCRNCLNDCPSFIKTRMMKEMTPTVQINLSDAAA